MIYTAKFSFMKEWKKYKLGELITLKYGKDHKKLNDGSFPVYGSGGVMRYGNDYIYDDSSILIPRKGSLNNIMFVDKPFWTVDTMFWSIIDQELVLPRFLYYTLCKYDFAGLNVGSAVPSLTVPVIESIEVVIPSIEKQKRILSLLVPLDDKIALNQRINDNLEQQAQALFKSWFVDFEPFKDGKFVESELGMIPKGWRVGTLNEIGNVVGGGTPSKSKPEYYCSDGIAWITPKDLSILKAKFIFNGEIDITELGYKNSSAKIMPKGSILFSSRAPIGYIAIAQNDITTNQGFKSVIPKKAGTAFIYLYLKENVDNIESQATGSTFKEASGSLMKAQKVVIPSGHIYDDFENLLQPIFKKQANLEIECRNLSTIRNTLLPKLMSGKLKINNLTR